MKIHLICVVLVTLLCDSIAEKLNSESKPKMIMGYTSGELKRCQFLNPKKCTILSLQDSPITSVAVAGEYVYIGLSSGQLRRCSLFRSSNCTIFHEFNTEINDMVVFRKNLYVGTIDGILKCGLRKSEDCQLFTFESEKPIYSLTAIGDKIYAGTDDDILKCSENHVQVCTLLLNTTFAVKAITAFGNHLYLGGKESVEFCDLQNGTDCYTLLETASPVTNLDIFERNLQISFESGEIMRFNFDTEEESIIVDSNTTSPVLSMSMIYDTTPVMKHYRGESNGCVWQFTACPPFIVYYDVQSRGALELHVKNNKVYTAEGDLFDTDESDFSHSGRKAIFVMDAAGKLFASNQHPIGVLHHSSLMSGKPAAAAGEITANQGEIEIITSCSGHYRPKITLVKQVISSLRRQGYEKDVTIKDCFGATDLLIDLNYKKTNLYYEAVYKHCSYKMNKTRI
ncbi:hypothetical protein O0L34_g12932 [Tuta absoluta]|nr:hypothetical protein O0L34_g12932 [Tuta absoluta]